MISLIALARALTPVCAWFPHGSMVVLGPPVNTSLPVISGTAQVGQTLNVSSGIWSGSPTSYAYQWQNEGSNLTGSGGPTTNAYTLQATDIGCLITCVVTAINSTGVSLPAYTALAGPALGTTVIYVSSSIGNDSTGTGAIGAPYKSLTKVNGLSLSPGTSVLFKRGDTWRSDGCATSSGAQLSPSSSGSAGSPIVFDAYGVGPNPVIDGSYDLSATGAWTQIGTSNVWQSAHTFNGFGHTNGLPNNAADDPGNLIWGISAVGGVNVPPALVNASYGVMTGNASSPFNGVWYKTGDNQANLTAPGQWNFNTDTNRVQVYSAGNPATSLPGVNGDLRAAIDTCLIYFNAQSYLTFQNLTLNYSGATGFDSGGAGGSCNNIIFRDCVEQWIGGGNISGHSDANSRYGDGWDMEGSAQNMLCERVWFHQIYDTGPGPQCGGGPHQDNITVRNCVCTDCGAFFSSFFLNGVPTANGLYIYNNSVYCTPNCWSNNPTQRPNGAENVYALNIVTISGSTIVQANMAIENNIFAGITGVSPSPGFGIIATGWSTASNPSNPYTASGVSGAAWLNYNCWPPNPLSPVGAPAQDIALHSGNYRMRDWVQGTNIAGAGTFTPALEVNGLFGVDPLFVSQSGLNLSLQANSPCLTAGVDLSGQGVVWDFNHQPRPVGMSGPPTFANITYIASAFAGALVAPGTLTINVPTGTQNGDVECCWITSNTDVIPTPPSGWAQIANADIPTGENMTLWTHVAASGDPSSWSWTNCTYPEGAIRTYRGVNNATPVLASGICEGSSTSCTIPSLVATIPTGAIYAAAWTADAGTITKPAGFGNDTNDATQRQLYAGDIALSAGSSAPSVTATVSPAEAFEGIGVVLNPAQQSQPQVGVVSMGAFQWIVPAAPTSAVSGWFDLEFWLGW